jgi:hypothetical protein
MGSSAHIAGYALRAIVSRWGVVGESGSCALDPIAGG